MPYGVMLDGGQIVRRPWLISKWYSRLNEKNQNWLCVIAGATGTGKSYCALRLARALDPSFTMDRCVFNVRDFLKLINSGKMKKGQIIVLDEAGVGIPAREFYTLMNRSINYVLQVFRRENIGVIMTVPSLAFIDKQARILTHTFIETLAVDREKNRVRVKVMEVQYNPQMGKIYYKYYRLGNKVLRKTFIGKPEPDIIEAYEIKKKEFAKDLYGKSMAIAMTVDKSGPSEEKATREQHILEVMKNPAKFTSIRGNITRALIMEHLGVRPGDADIIKDVANKRMAETKELQRVK